MDITKDEKQIMQSTYSIAEEYHKKSNRKILRNDQNEDKETSEAAAENQALVTKNLPASK